MKITIEVPDALVPYWTAEAEARGVALERLLVAKIFQTNHVVTGDVVAAPQAVEPPAPPVALQQK